MTNTPDYGINNNNDNENIITPISTIIINSPPQLPRITHAVYNIFHSNNDGIARRLFPLDEDDGKGIEYLNVFLDLSNLMFDIKEKISDKEYKDIMDTMSKLKNI
tara:strand:- start:6333 stop:6647 length:315 start_codon:yes stop_codon:yes gene_type:complete